MQREELRARQAPLKDQYAQQPDAAMITLSAPVQAVHLFDRESGLRVNS